MPPTPQRRYRRVGYQDNPTQFNRVTAPVGTFLPTPAPNIFQPPINSQLPPFSNPSTAQNGNLGAPYAMQPARPTYVPPGASNAPRPPMPNAGSSFSGWTQQNAAAQRAALSPQAGMNQYLASERGSVPIGTRPSGMPLSSSSMYGGLEYTQGMLSSGQLPASMNSFMLQQLQAQGMDTSTLTAYYQPDGQGGYKLNAQGIQQNSQAVGQQAQTNTVTNNLGTGSSEFMNTGFMQQNAANNVSFTNQLRWDPDRKKYVKIGQLIKEDRLDVKDKNARLKRRRGGGGGGGQSYVAPVDPVSEPQLATGGASAFISFNTATG